MKPITELKTNFTKEQAEEFIKNYKEGEPIPDELIQYALNWGRETAAGLRELAAEVKKVVDANRRTI